MIAATHAAFVTGLYLANRNTRTLAGAAGVT